MQDTQLRIPLVKPNGERAVARGKIRQNGLDTLYTKRIGVPDRVRPYHDVSAGRTAKTASDSTSNRLIATAAQRRKYPRITGETADSAGGYERENRRSKRAIFRRERISAGASGSILYARSRPGHEPPDLGTTTPVSRGPTRNN